jgi:malate dehydrogenase (quinone)
LSIQVLEISPQLSQESSDGWHNAGTGHAGYCEFSYTPHRDTDGWINVSRAIAIFEQFEHSKLFWASAVQQGITGPAKQFVRPVPHLAFVTGASQVDYLRARHQAMTEHPFFEQMQYTDDAALIAQWLPLIMEGREPSQVAATVAKNGTEVNFGELARQLWNWFGQQDNCAIATEHRAVELSRQVNSWHVRVKDLQAGQHLNLQAKFVFLGAGGGCLPLLHSTGLPEVKGLGGFPIAGQWLVCDDANLAARHLAKVYGLTPPSAPSLGGPHLDVRWLGDSPQLMFGPFASWTTKYLKKSGHWSDLPRAVHWDNLMTFLRVAKKNRSLVSYLMAQGLQSSGSRMASLRQFYPLARREDWRLVHAGIRVQTLKRQDRGAIYFGTEIFKAAGGTLAALLGASPGASVSVNIALNVVRSCLPDLLRSTTGIQRLRQLIPNFDTDIKQPENAALYRSATQHAAEVLGIQQG